MEKFLPKSEKCLLCGSRDLRAAFQVHYWRENVLRYSDCAECSATFANPMPSNALIGAGNNALVRLYQKDRSIEQEYREARQAYLRGKMLARKLRRWRRRGRVLELGCYHGFFSLGIRENSDWEVEGLEISTELQSFVQDRLGLRCYLGTLEDAELPLSHFDFVVCHDLIEHVNRPQSFLEKLSAILSRGGRVQIITPNSRQDLAYTRRANDAGVPMAMLLNHILYFRPETLRRSLASVGLEPRHLYCYDIRYAAKDFGWFGLGQVGPNSVEAIPSMEDALALPEKKTLSIWNASNIAELRSHRKTSWAYGLMKEALPKALTLRVPARFGLGHEIYALAEKPR